MAMQRGEFNFALKKTGFLGETKMRAKRISKNPKLFLETYAEKDVEIVPLECAELEGFIDNLKNESHYESKESGMLRRHELAKKRSFLLNLATSTHVSAKVGNDLDYLQEKEDIQKIDNMIDTFLAQIKDANLTAIESWLSTEITMKNLKLPYGLPNKLKLPLDPNHIGDGKDMDDVLIDFIECTNDDFLLLDGEYHTKLEEITKKLQINFELMSEHNWPLKETALLSYVVTSIGESASQSATALLNELTIRLFPSKNKEDIIAQKYRLKTKRFLEDKEASVIRDWIRDKEDLQGKVNLAWQEMNKKRLLKLEQILNRRKQDIVCRHWTEQVDKLRKAKCEKIRRLQITVEPLEKKRADQIRLQRENEEYRRAVIKLEVKKYEEEKTIKKFNEIRKQETVSNMLREIEKVQAKKNKSRVDFRTERLQYRAKAKNEIKIAMEQDLKLRNKILESTKEPVEINYDPSSIVADTHATAVRRYETLAKNNAEDVAMIKFFRERYSFSAETVLKDRRNRVEAKLREVGLLDSTYARQVLLAMEPKAKPHLQCQIKFQYDE